MSSILEQLLFYFMSSSEILVQIVFICNFAFSAVSSGNFFSCTIFCSTFSLTLLFCFFLTFRFHVSKAHSIS